MKTLIAIVSCFDHYLEHQNVRETWLRGYQGDYKFFVGAGGAPTHPTKMQEFSWTSRFTANAPIPYGDQTEVPRLYPLLQPDEVIFACPDTYRYLPYKSQGVQRYAVKNGYDFTFQCNIDTYVFLDRLLASDFAQYDYTGWETFGALPEPPLDDCDDFSPWQYLRKAGGLPWASDKPYASGGSGYWLSRRCSQIIANEPVTHWAEDLWVGAVLHREGIRLHHDHRYDSRAEGDLAEIFTRHLVACGDRGGDTPTVRSIHEEAGRR